MQSHTSLSPCRDRRALLAAMLFTTTYGKLMAEQRPASNGLADANFFTLGKDGNSGSRSEAEMAFFTAMGRHDSIELFERIFQEGTSEAQAYALCGMRLLNPDRFSSLANQFRKQTDFVRVVKNGSVYRRYSSERLIEEISHGWVADFFGMKAAA